MLTALHFFEVCLQITCSIAYLFVCDFYESIPCKETFLLENEVKSKCIRVCQIYIKLGSIRMSKLTSANFVDGFICIVWQVKLSVKVAEENTLASSCNSLHLE